ncbi:MAG: nucleotidyltransferase domain-containing protein [Candidatus Ratteibacteria bacterium]
MNRIERIVECIKKYQPEKIIVFGSYARGEGDEYSDIDFIVIKKTEKRFIERLIEVAKLIDNKWGDIDIFVYTPEEFEQMSKLGNSFIESVLKEGKVIYEKK